MVDYSESIRLHHIPALQDVTLADIPPRIGLLPLKGAILLPKGQLPLTIFEPRYIALINQSLTQQRLIGLIQPSHTETYGDISPTLEQVGTVGRITSFTEQDNGQFFITLTGVIRFRLLREKTTEYGWRQAMINATPFVHDLLESPPVILDRKTLSHHLQDYSEHYNLNINWKALKNLDTETLLTMLPMLLPFSPEKKQTLLETEELDERADVLLNLLSHKTTS